MIFLSYRYEDAAIVRALQQAFEVRQAGHLIVRDLNTFRPGEDLREIIPTELRRVESVLVIIGRNWMRNDGSQERKPRPSVDQDWVRYEVSLALAWGKRVLPVLVDGTEMPARSALPSDLAELTNKIALTLRDTDWESDVDALFEQIGVAASSAKDQPTPGPTISNAGPVAGRDVVIRGSNAAGRDLTVNDD